MKRAGPWLATRRSIYGCKITLLTASELGAVSPHSEGSHGTTGGRLRDFAAGQVARMGSRECAVRMWSGETMYSLCMCGADVTITRRRLTSTDVPRSDTLFRNAACALSSAYPRSLLDHAAIYAGPHVRCYLYMFMGINDIPSMERLQTAR